MLDENASLVIGDVDLQNYSVLPSLSELCLRYLRNIRLPQSKLHACNTHIYFLFIADDLPYLISSLVIGEQQVSSIVATQKQWLQKQLSDVEMFGLHEENVKGKKERTDKKKLRIYDVPSVWEIGFRPICVNDIEEKAFPHVPLSMPGSRNYLIDDFNQSHKLFPLILHYTNYYYPLALDDRVDSKSLTKVQDIAIGRVTYLFQSR